MDKITSRIEYIDGSPIAVIELNERMEILSSCMLNGGLRETSSIIIIQVPGDYDCSDPIDDAVTKLRKLGLPDDTACFMTAAEVDYVFSRKTCDHNGFECIAFSTAGLANQVIAGDELTDWEKRKAYSNKKHMSLIAKPPGTINTIGITSRPLSDSAKVNTLIAMVEAKTAAMNDLGHKETGTTSDSIAILCPKNGEREEYSGTGYGFGLSLAKAVRAAVRESLLNRDDFPMDMSAEEAERIRRKFE